MKGERILVVGAEQADRSTIRGLLAPERCSVHEAEDARAGWGMLHQVEPTLIIVAEHLLDGTASSG